MLHLFIIVIVRIPHWKCILRVEKVKLKKSGVDNVEINVRSHFCLYLLLKYM